MNVTEGGEHRGWDPGWEGHSLAQQRRLARLPLWEKLAWLEEAHRLARRLTMGERPAGPEGEKSPPSAGC